MEARNESIREDEAEKQTDSVHKISRLKSNESISSASIDYEDMEPQNRATTSTMDSRNSLDNKSNSSEEYRSRDATIIYKTNEDAEEQRNFSVNQDRVPQGKSNRVTIAENKIVNEYLEDNDEKTQQEDEEEVEEFTFDDMLRMTHTMIQGKRFSKAARKSIWKGPEF